jgi:hypothetical protein
MAAAPPAPVAILARFPGAVFPVDGGYSFVDDWHAPRKGHLHMGIDIAAAYGTPVVAVMDGHISSMAHGGAGGIDLFLTTAGGDSFLYCHFSRYLHGLHVGQQVKAGEVIAYVGATGDATGPHLHFEIHPHGGAPINPYPYLQAWRAGASSGAGDGATATPAAPVAGASVLSPTRRRSAFGVQDGVTLAGSVKSGRLGRAHDDWWQSVAMETTLTLIATGTLVALRRRMMLGAQLLGPTGGRP